MDKHEDIAWVPGNPPEPLPGSRSGGLDLHDLRFEEREDDRMERESPTTPTFALHQGDAGEVLPTLPRHSVQAVLTSPPYYMCRDYGVETQIGREATLLEYVDRVVDVLDACRHALDPRGVMWLNLGDVYGGSRLGGPEVGVARKSLAGAPWRVALRLIDRGWLLRNDVIWWKLNGLPEDADDRCILTHEYVFAFTRGDDYYWNADAIRESYAESTLAELKREYRGEARKADYASSGAQNPSDVKRRIQASIDPERGPNRRSVWPIATQPSFIEHYALMPTTLAERCIQASTRPGGRHCDCAELIRTPTGKRTDEDPTEKIGGKGLRRKRQPGEGSRPITRREQRDHAAQLKVSPHRRAMHDEAGRAFEHYLRTDRAGARPIPPELLQRWIERGWLSDSIDPCSCPVSPPDAVLDPFCGAGTTGVAALTLGRRFVGIELNESYVDMARDRLAAVAPLFVHEEEP